MAKALLTNRQTRVAEYRSAGLTRREIAAKLTEDEGKPVTIAAVKQRLNRARKRTSERYRKIMGSQRIVPIQFRTDFPLPA